VVNGALPTVVALVILPPDGSARGWLSVLSLSVAATASWLFVSRVVHQYDASNGRGFRGDLALTGVLLASTIVLVWLASRLGLVLATTAQVARFGACLAVVALTTRLALVGFPLWRSRPSEDVLILGTGPLGRHTGNDILEGGRKQLAGYLSFDDEQPHLRLHAELLGRAGDLETVLRARVVDEVYLASTEPAHAPAVQAAIQTCERFGVPFALPACAYRVVRAQAANEKAVEDGYVHYLGTSPKPVQHALKRALDILVSGAALVALGPLLVGIALAIKLTSPGGVLYRQERVGLRGRRFKMLKFRSMVVDAEARLAELAARNEQTGPVFKMTHDPRVTRIGRFIRKFSIDELPQLVNVLRGDMSLVGPRPPIPGEVARYEAWQLRRLSVRPGLTCVWQVSGRNAIAFEDWMMLDLRYIDHWTLANDIALIARTVPVVLTGRGAS
jgi:exopolysaccharide biosynthesis polyprenyl glycosylphosphotransferase